jgi:7-carboxy-7-deazaguanine synthase
MPLKIRSKDELPVSEMFYSIQGEGKMVGRPSLFLRTSMCNLRCAWGDTLCDSWYTSHAPTGAVWTIDEIIGRIHEMGALATHLVITGGEPCMWPEQLLNLCHRLRYSDSYVQHITVETNGTLFVRELMDYVDLLSISPKLDNSEPTEVIIPSLLSMHGKHEDRGPELVEQVQMIHKARRDYGPINEWLAERGVHGPEVQLKFVLYESDDLREVDELLQHLDGWFDPDIYLMPEGVTAEECWRRAEWIKEICLERNWSFSPRIQLDLFGNRRAT